MWKYNMIVKLNISSWQENKYMPVSGPHLFDNAAYECKLTKSSIISREIVNDNFENNRPPLYQKVEWLPQHYTSQR